MSKLGDEIAKIVFRKRRGFRFTQADLGNRIGVSGSYISAIEAGKSSPRISEPTLFGRATNSRFIPIPPRSTARRSALRTRSNL